MIWPKPRKLLFLTIGYFLVEVRPNLKALDCTSQIKVKLNVLDIVICFSFLGKNEHLKVVILTLR